jgi:hypothetical protein
MTSDEIITRLAEIVREIEAHRAATFSTLAGCGYTPAPLLQALCANAGPGS